VKPNEVNHDAGIYPMYRKAAREIRARAARSSGYCWTMS
jgi:hypothetical protein